MTKILAFLSPLVLVLSAQAEFVEGGDSPYQQIVKVRVHKPFGPDVEPLLMQVKDVVTEDENATIDDARITARNGYGTPLAGEIVFTPKHEPRDMEKVIWMEIQLSPNCGWGNVFEETAEALRFAKLSDKTLFYYDLTSANGYGKPCSAKLGFLSRDNRK